LAVAAFRAISLSAGFAGCRHHAREHLPRNWRDPFSAAAHAPLTAPTVWLLSAGWRI